MKGIQSLQYTGQMVTYTGLNSRNELKKRVASRRGEVLGKKQEKKKQLLLEESSGTFYSLLSRKELF